MKWHRNSEMLYNRQYDVRQMGKYTGSKMTPVETLYDIQQIIWNI